MSVGDRVGVARLHRTCGVCGFRRRGRENPCDAAEFTGWTADGGFRRSTRRWLTSRIRSPRLSDREAAPLLCAGIIGYRAPLLAGLPDMAGAARHLRFERPGTSPSRSRAAAAPGLVCTAIAAGSSPRDGARRARVGRHRRTPWCPMRRRGFAPAGELVHVALAAVAGGSVARRHPHEAMSAACIACSTASARPPSTTRAPTGAPSSPRSRASRPHAHRALPLTAANEALRALKPTRSRRGVPEVIEQTRDGEVRAPRTLAARGAVRRAPCEAGAPTRDRASPRVPRSPKRAERHPAPPPRTAAQSEIAFSFFTSFRRVLRERQQDCGDRASSRSRRRAA
jgi:hypothetical protein